MTNFKNIEYLKSGNSRQKSVYSILLELQIFTSLQEYNPILTGTIPIEIDLPNSDVDIICECNDHLSFAKNLKEMFEKHTDFQIWTNTYGGVKATVANFSYKKERIEIFGQNIPTDQQNSYQHLLIERKILEEKGLEFKNQVIEFKKSGLKTEPAFAKLLHLEGDPYAALLKYGSIEF